METSQPYLELQNIQIYVMRCCVILKHHIILSSSLCIMLWRLTLTPLYQSHQLAAAVDSFFQNVNAEHISDANERLHVQLLDLFIYLFKKNKKKSLVNHIVGGSEHCSRFLFAQAAGTWWEKKRLTDKRCYGAKDGHRTGTNLRVKWKRKVKC